MRRKHASFSPCITMPTKEPLFIPFLYLTRSKHLDIMHFLI